MEIRVREVLLQQVTPGLSLEDRDTGTCWLKATQTPAQQSQIKVKVGKNAMGFRHVPP